MGQMDKMNNMNKIEKVEKTEKIVVGIDFGTTFVPDFLI